MIMDKSTGFSWWVYGKTTNSI